MNRSAFLCAACLVVACSSEQAPPPSSSAYPDPIKELSYEIFPFVIQLDNRTLEFLTRSDEDGTLVFPADAPLPELTTGDIILGGSSDAAPQGLLRIVREVYRQEDSVVIHTVGAPPQLAFRTLHVRAEAQIPSLTDPSTDWTFPNLGPLIAGSGAGEEEIDFYLFDGDGDTSTTDDQVHVVGKIGGGIHYDVGIDTDWGALDALANVEDCVGKVLSFGLTGDCELPELEAYLYVTPSTNAEVLFEGAAFQRYEKEHELASVLPQPYLLPIGPLTFTIDVDVVARIEGAASSRFSVGAAASIEATTGLEFGSMSGVHFEPPVPVYEFAPTATDVTLSGQAKVGIGPRLSFQLYGVAGPYAGLYATASLDADQTRSPCFELAAGADAEVGFILSLPGLGTIIREGESFELFDETIASGNCAQPSGASTYPPGEGPDPEHLLNPTFDPWAWTYDTPVSRMPHQSGDFAWVDVDRSIDGNWVISGSGLGTLTKLDANGEVVWARQYVDPDTNHAYDVKRTAPTLGAGLLVIVEPYGLMEVGQSGGVKWATRFSALEELTDTGPNGWASDQRTFFDMCSDSDGGFVVAGSFQHADGEDPAAWILRVDRHGDIVSSSLYRADRALYPLALVPLIDGVFVAGMDWNGERRGLWLSRIGSDGVVQWAKRFEGCEGIGYANAGMQPFEARSLSGGGILVAGAIDQERRSFVMEVTADGAVQWATSQWANDPLSSLTIHEVRELPTTGFVAAGRYQHQFDEDRLFLAGLDAKGRTQWLRAYGQRGDDPGIGADQQFPGMQLTDEGAVIVAGYTNAPMPAADSNLWVFQAAAKDGSVSFGPGQGESDEFPHATIDCTLAPLPLALTLEEFDLGPGTFVPPVRDVALESK